MKNIAIIYHNPCMDGILSAYRAVTGILQHHDVHYCPFHSPNGDHRLAVTKFNDRDEEFQLAVIASSYRKHHVDNLQQDYAEYLKDAEIFIVDFSLSVENTRALAQFANSITVIDHHRTATDTLLGADLPSNVELHLDSTGKFCGAQLVEQFFELDSDTLTEYVADYDLWTHNMPETYAMAAGAYFYIASQHFMDAYELLFDTNACGENQEFMNKLLEHGTVLHTERLRTAEHVKRNAREYHDGIYIVNCPTAMASLALNQVMQVPGSKIAICYADMKYTRMWSVRSDTKHRDDCLAADKVCELFGGGGHPDAGGFESDFGLSPQDVATTIYETFLENNV